MSETVKKVESVTRTATRTATAKKNNEHVIYLGPTIKGIVESGTSFTNGLPKKFKEFSEKNPIVNELIVPIKNFADARKELRSDDSPMAVFFNSVKEIAEKMKKGE